MNEQKTPVILNPYEKEIVQVFADVTRYPAELLDLDASLEDDLGIDSIKLAEIFTVLHTTYQLPAHNIFRIPREALVSIGSVIKFLQPYVKNMQAIAETVDESTPIARLRTRLDRQEINDPLFNNGTTETPGQIMTTQHNNAAKKIKAGEPQIQEFMRHIAAILHIPIQLLRPYDRLATDLSLDEHKLKQLLEALDTEYALSQRLSQKANMPYVTLEDIANEVAELRSPNITADMVVECIHRGHFSNTELSHILKEIADHIKRS